MILVAGPSLSTDQISWSAAGALDSAIFTSTIAYVHFVPRLPLIRKTLTAGPPMILVFTVIPAFQPIPATLRPSYLSRGSAMARSGHRRSKHREIERLIRGQINEHFDCT
jgi:hypothetical protein